MVHRKTPAATVELVRLRAARGDKQVDIARDLGLSRSHVSNIVRGRTRLEVDGPVRDLHGNERHGRYKRQAARRRRR